MTSVKFVKSFSKGQITIPKEFREIYELGDDFWLKLYLQDGKIIAEPVERTKNRQDYKKKLLKIKGNWIDIHEIARNRRQIERKIAAL